MPTSLHFGSPNPPKPSQKSIPRCIKFLIDFCIDFFSILALSWDPSWGHVGHFFGTRRPQDPPKRHQKLVQTLKTAQNAILAPPDLHFAPPGLDFDAPRPPFCSPGPRFSCLRSSIFKRFKVVPLLHYYIVTFGLQTSILGEF